MEILDLDLNITFRWPTADFETLSDKLTMDLIRILDP